MVPSFTVLLLKGCLWLLQDLLYDICWRFIDFQPFGFYSSLGHASGFLRLFFFLLPASFIILCAVHAPFPESAQLCFLSTGLTSFPCAWFLFNDDCHLYAIYDIQNIYCKSRFLFYYFRVIFFLNVTFYNNFIT